MLSFENNTYVVCEKQNLRTQVGILPPALNDPDQNYDEGYDQ